MNNVIYSNARAKTLEKLLLGADRIGRMTDSADAEEALKILSETDFGGGVQISGAAEYEKLTVAETVRFINFVKETCPSEDFKRFLLLKNDFHNAEALIKSKYLKTDAQAMLTESGIIDVNVMRERIMADEYKSFPISMAEALGACDADFVSGKATGQSVGLFFLKAYFNELYSTAKKDKILLEIYKTKVDCANITTALRTRNFAASLGGFINNGNLTLSEFKALNDESFEVLKNKFRFSPQAELIYTALNAAEKGQPLTDFEKNAESYAVNLMLKNKFSAQGMLPFMQYCFYKKADIANVRIIFAGLLNGLKSKEIKERLRDYYAW